MGMSISFSGTVLPLLTFNTTYSRDGTVQTQVKRNGGAATLQHAFVARIFGPTAVFERVGSPRFPVEQKFGPSTGHMMRNEEVIEKMDETIRDTFQKQQAAVEATRKRLEMLRQQYDNIQREMEETGNESADMKNKLLAKQLQIDKTSASLEKQTAKIISTKRSGTSPPTNDTARITRSLKTM